MKIYWRNKFQAIMLGVAVAFGVSLLPSVGADLSFGVGPAFRGGMKVTLGGLSHAQMLAPPVGIGSTDAYADRSYDNGFVFIDSGTGNPNSLDPITTWFWRYDNASQYNPAANTLTFQKAGATGFIPAPGSNLERDKSLLGIGLEVSAGIQLKRTQKWRADLCLGFQGVWSPQNRFSSSASGTLGYSQVTDVYSTAGIAPADFPAAGVSGSYNGPFDVPPPGHTALIPNLPGTRTFAPVSTGQGAVNSVSWEIDQGLYQLWLGPKIGLQLGHHIHVTFLPKLASLNIVNVSIDRKETLAPGPSGSVTLNQWHDSADKTHLSYGMGIQGGLEFDSEKGFFFAVFGGYEWVMNDTKINVGPATATLRPSGFVAGAAVGKRF